MDVSLMLLVLFIMLAVKVLHLIIKICLWTISFGSWVFTTWLFWFAALPLSSTALCFDLWTKDKAKDSNAQRSSFSDDRPAFRLLDLPVEIRLQILEYCIPGDANFGTLDCQNFKRYFHILVSTTRVCRVMRAEAFETFFRKATFVLFARFEPDAYHIALNKDERAQQYNNLRRIRDRPLNDVFILSPSLPPHIKKHIRHLHVSCCIRLNSVVNVPWQNWRTPLESLEEQGYTALRKVDVRVLHSPMAPHTSIGSLRDFRLYLLRQNRVTDGVAFNSRVDFGDHRGCSYA